MEKKKLLLVAVSVGLFLVIVIGASILVFSPTHYQNIATKPEEVPIAPGKVPPVSFTQTPPPAAPPPPAPPPPPAEITEGTTEIVIDQSHEKQQNTEGIIIDGGKTTPKENDNKTVTVPSPYDNKPTAAPAVAAAKSAAPQKPATAAAKPAVAAKPAAATKASQTPHEGYWVQTGSFSQKALADNAKKYLAEKGITSVIMDGEVGSKTYYRVRVGPYLSKNEADYWLTLIQSIDGLEKSLVFKSRL